MRKIIFHFKILLDAASRAKAEKIRLALEKMREASVQKLFIKAFTLDGSGKSLLVDEGMSVAHVCRLLADKNHVAMDPKWAVVEHLPELFMGKLSLSIYRVTDMLLRLILAKCIVEKIQERIKKFFIFLVVDVFFI